MASLLARANLHAARVVAGHTVHKVMYLGMPCDGRLFEVSVASSSRATGHSVMRVVAFGTRVARVSSANDDRLMTREVNPAMAFLAQLVG